MSKSICRALWQAACSLGVMWACASAMAAAANCTAEGGEVSVHCGNTPSATFDDLGRLWVAFVQGQHVYVSHSADLGRTYSPPVKVNIEPEEAEHNGENRPKILVIDEESEHAATVLVSWTLKTSARFTGEIRFSRSTDGGRSFALPRTINDDELFAGHRFESMYLTESGHLYLSWIDKRDLESSSARGEDYVGAAVYYAVSHDGGASFSANYPVAAHSCECCRIAVAPRGNENIAILWRQIFGADVRDHAIAELTPAGKVLGLNRATYDEWHIDACPHHGPAMVQAANADDYHLSWFSNGDAHQGIYYASYSFADRQARHVYRVDGAAGAGHPHLALRDGVLHLVWKGFDGQSSHIRLIRSFDAGASWSEPETLLSTNEASDYPLLVQSPDGLFLSWHGEEHGYVLQAIPRQSRALPDIEE